MVNNVKVSEAKLDNNNRTTHQNTPQHSYIKEQKKDIKLFVFK